MTREEIIRTISNEYSVNEIQAADFYDNIFSALAKSLAKGKNVNIAEFGKFSVYEKVNESKKKRKFVRFSPVKKFADEINRDYCELKAVRVRLIDAKQADKSFEDDLDLVDYVEDGDFLLSGRTDDKDSGIKETQDAEISLKPEEKEGLAEVKVPIIIEKPERIKELEEVKIPGEVKVPDEVKVPVIIEKPERTEGLTEVKVPDINDKLDRIEELSHLKSTEVFDLDLIQENITAAGIPDLENFIKPDDEKIPSSETIIQGEPLITEEDKDIPRQTVFVSEETFVPIDFDNIFAESIDEAIIHTNDIKEVSEIKAEEHLIPEIVSAAGETDEDEIFRVDVFPVIAKHTEDVIFPIYKKPQDKSDAQGDANKTSDIKTKTQTIETNIPASDSAVKTKQEEINLIKDGILDSKNIEDDLKNIIAEREKILKEIEAIRSSDFNLKSQEIKPVIPETEIKGTVFVSEDEIIPIQPVQQTPFMPETTETDYLDKLFEEREIIRKQISNPELSVFDKLVGEDRFFKEKTIDDDIQNLDQIKLNLKSGSDGTIDDLMTFDEIMDFDIDEIKDSIVFPEELKGLHDDILTPGEEIVKPAAEFPKKFDDIFIEDSNMLNFSSSEKDKNPNPKHTSDLDDKIKNYDDIFRLAKRPKKK